MIILYKSYKFRIYLNHEQSTQINKTFGCARFIYNYFLNKCKENKYIKAYDMCNMLKDLQEEYEWLEYEWLKEVDSCALRCAIFNLEASFKNLFSKRTSYPKFKSKYNKQSYRTNCIKRTYKGKEYSNIILDLKNKKIKLPKLGIVNIRGYRNLDHIEGKIINACITKETTGKYYVSVLVEKQDVNIEKVKAESIVGIEVGIDLGVKDIVVTSNGEKYINPKELDKREKRLKRLQRKLSRQIKGSNNYNKTKIKISRVYSKIKNARQHNIITIVNKLVKENDIIISEKLQVKKMHNNHTLTKNILDASFNRICNMLKWKTKEKGKYYYQVDSYFPSSKLCSCCGNKTEKTKSLSIRSWTCDYCDSINDRDINASINIMFEGLKMYMNEVLI